MVHRRTFIVGIAALGAVRLSSERALAQDPGEAIEAIHWFVEAVKLLPGSVEGFFGGLRRIRYQTTLTLSTQALLQDVRRKLTDEYPANALQTKLATWLQHYDAWVDSKQRPGESQQDFVARKERERQSLQQEWKRVRDDAAAALAIADTVGKELDSIDPRAIPAQEWRAYNDLLQNEKELAGFINADMPTDPHDIEELRQASEQLKKVIQTIDEHQAELDKAIHTKPG